MTQRSLDNISPAFVLAQGPSVAPVDLTPDAGLGQGVFSVDRDLGSGYVQQWNLAVQRDLGGDLAVEVAYAGSKITHIGVPDTNINQLTVEQLALGTALLQHVPNPSSARSRASSSLGDRHGSRARSCCGRIPRFTTVSLYRNNVGNTSYNALAGEAREALLARPVVPRQLHASKLIDTASSVFDASILAGPVANFPVADSFNRALERDVSTGDIPHVFVASFVWDLPWGKGRRFEPRGRRRAAGRLAARGHRHPAVGHAARRHAGRRTSTPSPASARSGRTASAIPNLPSDERSTARWFDTERLRRWRRSSRSATARAIPCADRDIATWTSR